MPFPEDSKLGKTNLWLMPLLGLGLFVPFSVGYAYLVLSMLMKFNLIQGNYFRIAGSQFFVGYGSGCAALLLGIIVVGGLLSTVTTTVILKSAPKALSALRKNRAET